MQFYDLRGINKIIYNNGVVHNVISGSGEEHNEPRSCGSDIEKHISLGSITQRLTHTHARRE